MTEELEDVLVGLDFSFHCTVREISKTPLLCLRGTSHCERTLVFDLCSHKCKLFLGLVGMQVTANLDVLQTGLIDFAVSNKLALTAR